MPIMVSPRARLVFSLCLLAVLSPTLDARRQAPARVTATGEAIRLNNLGVASMNQQKPEVALERFEASARADASLVAARVNQAIAMTALQRYEPAQQMLEAVVKADPTHVRAWYNLGLLGRTLGQSDAALAAFTRATELAPTDPYAHYFVGLISSQLQQHDKAIASFTRALAIDPFLVSAEFGLARSYQRSGKTEDAKTHMDRFTRLTQEKVASAMSLSYGEQGPLSLAEAVLPPAGMAPPAIAVKFVAPKIAPPLHLDREPIVGGICVIDANGDGALDYVRLARGAVTVMRNDGRGQFTESQSLAVTFGVAGACAVGDYDNDEKPDVVVASGTTLALFHNDGGTFSRAAIAFPGASAMLGVSLVDVDHDADLDLLVAASADVNFGDAGTVGGVGPQRTASTVRLYRNNGDGTFADVTAERGLGSLNAVAITASDLNNDRAIDLVLTGAKATVLINPREGAYKTHDAFKPTMPADTRGVVALDFDKDGWMDLAFTHQGAPGLSLWRNIEGKTFDRVDLPSSSTTNGRGLTAIDYDNDGWLDLAATGAFPPTGELVVLRNVAGRFENVSAGVAVGATTGASPGSLVAGDFDGDNDSDLLVVDPMTGPVVLRNDGGNANNAVRIALLGLNDNRSGIGTKVEVQAGTVWQKFETVSASGLAGQGSPEILAGIGKATQADVVRMLWPTGVVQDEVELKANTRHAITQIDRRGSSCPVLFSWNGERYEFVADAIGPAVVGHWVAPDTRNISDVDELVKVDGRQVRVKDGRVSFRFAEPMEEVIYLDQVKLFAIDHPDGSDVYPNEYFAAMPPHPVDHPIASRHARLPVSAWDGEGHDVMPALRERDRRFVPLEEGARQEGATSVAPIASRPYSFKGFAPLHSLELDLGELPTGAPVRLLMHGFTDYFTATSVFAAHQANVTAVLPWVEARRPDGTWTRISDDIGFPAGLLRTMTADLTGKLPVGARRIRIWTNLKIYWDQVLVDTTPEGAVPVRRTEIPLAEASLAFRGFPRELTGTPATDLQYVHGEVSKYGPYARHRGFYTKYGAVTPLLKGAEDQFVVFGAGDEVALEFDGAALRPLKAGWTRDYFVYFNGYVKDMDFYAAHGQTVGPLPFKGMPGYPYPTSVSYPDRNREYQLEWNTREVVGESWPSYRFSFRHNPDDTMTR
jgi:Tfp pilus assembly protein PilF